jgi:hypothetical protein
VSAADFAAVGRLTAERIRGNRAGFVKAAKGLGMKLPAAMRAFDGGGVGAFRTVARQCPEIVVGGAELIGALAGHAADARHGPATFRELVVAGLQL